MNNPIKRHDALKPISREHHHGLLLSWKIKEGLRKKFDVERIKDYVMWFWHTFLEKHFDFEEKYVLSILNPQDSHVKKIYREHRRIKGLILRDSNVEQSLYLIEEELIAHIRYEERILLNIIQEKASEEQISAIFEHHKLLKFEGWEDQFWL